MFPGPDRLFRRYRETGDPRYLGRVFDRTAPELLRVASYLTRDRHRAEDVVQTTFLIAIEKASSYDPSRPLLPWLLAILANEARQLHRRERRVQPKSEGVENAPTTAGDVADAAATTELARSCDQALEALPEPYRPVLILHLRHGLSGQEIAVTLARPDSTVRNQIARGLELLRKKLPAGIAGVVVFGTATGRGLAAMRRAVLAHVPSPAASVAGGAFVGAGIAGGLFMMKYFVVAAALLAIAGFGAWTTGWFARGSAALGEAPPTAAVVWVAGATADERAASASPTTIDFVRSPVAGKEGEGVSPVQTLGPLVADQKQVARQHLTGAVAASYMQWERECLKAGSGPNGVKTLTDAVGEMHLLLMARRQEAHLKALEDDSYMTVDAASPTADDLVWPSGYLTSVLRGAASVGGTRVNIVFGIAPSDPIVAQMIDELCALETAASKEQIAVFNAQELLERQSRYEGSVGAIAELRSIDLAMDAAERRRKVDVLVKRMLPGDWVFDTRSFLARLR